MFCLWRDWGYGFGGGKTTEEVLHHIPSGVRSPNMTHADVHLDHLAEPRFLTSFSTIKFSFPHPFSYCIFERKSLWVAHTEKVGVIYSPPPRGGVASGFFCLGDLSILPR